MDKLAPVTSPTPWIALGLGATALATLGFFLMRSRQNPIETSSYVISSPTEAVTVTDIATVPEVAKRLEKNGPISIREVFPDGQGRWIVPPAECLPEAYPPPRSIPPEYFGPRPTAPPPRYAPPPTPRPRRHVRRACPIPKSPVLAGVNIIQEAQRLLRTQALRGMPMPNIRIRRSTRSPRVLGTAYFEQHMIRLVDYPGIDKYDVYETLSHELAHLRTGRKGGRLVGSQYEGNHGVTWKTNFAKIVEEGYRTRIPILRATHGQVSNVMRGGRRPSAGEGLMECCY